MLRTVSVQISTRNNFFAMYKLYKHLLVRIFFKIKRKEIYRKMRLNLAHILLFPYIRHRFL